MNTQKELTTLLERREQLIQQQKAAEKIVNETETQLIDIERTIAALEKELENKRKA